MFQIKNNKGDNYSSYFNSMLHFINTLFIYFTYGYILFFSLFDVKGGFGKCLQNTTS